MLTLEFPKNFQPWLNCPPKPFWFGGRLIFLGMIRPRKLHLLAANSAGIQEMATDYQFNDYELLTRPRRICQVVSYKDNVILLTRSRSFTLVRVGRHLNLDPSGLAISRISRDDNHRLKITHLGLEPALEGTTELAQEEEGNVKVVRGADITKDATRFASRNFAARLLSLKKITGPHRGFFATVFVVDAAAQTVKALKIDHPATATGVSPDRLVGWACFNDRITFFDLEH